MQRKNEYGGTRLQYRAGLGEILTDLRRAQIFNLDIGTGDPITPAPQLETMQGIGGETISWLVYPIETIVAEKLHPLVQRGSENSRSKDIFDLGFYLPRTQPKLLSEAIERTFAFRGDAVPTDFAAFLEGLDRSLLQRGWSAATKTIKNKSDFNQVFDSILLWLRNHGF